MHRVGLIHRDLKPANVFVTRGNVVKLGDFGLTRSLSEGHPLTQEVVTPSYRAPEVILGDPNYGPAVDVWSLGCVLYEMITAQKLFSPSTATHPGQLDSIFRICGSPTEESWPGFADLPGGWLAGLHRARPSSLREKLLGMPPEFAGFVDLMENMLQLDPARRITVEQALGHPLLQREFVLPQLAIPEAHAMDVPKRTRNERQNNGCCRGTGLPQSRVLPVPICV